MEKFERSITNLFLIFLFSLGPNVVFGNEYEKLIKKYKKEIKSKESEIEQIEKKIEEKKAEKTKYEKEEKQIRSELTKIEQDLNKVISEIVKIQSNIRKTEKKLKQTEQELKIASNEIDYWKTILSKDLRFLYKNFYGTYCLFTDPWTENLIVYTLKSKANKIVSVTERKLYTERALNKYIETKNELEKLKESLSEKQSEYKKIQNEKTQILSSVKGKRISAEEEIKRLNETSKELKALIDSLEKKKQETLEIIKQEELAKKEFKEKKHYLPWPVTGEVITKFGKNKHPELDTYVISNGIKIKTDGEQQVVSVDDGEVIYAKEFRSYRKTVIIDHKGGVYTIYGYLGEILVDEGTKIKKGQQIGKTDSLNNNTIYFEIRVDGQPEDPLDWLSSKK